MLNNDYLKRGKKKQRAALKREFVAKTNSNRPWIGFRFVLQNGAVKQYKPQRERRSFVFS